MSRRLCVAATLSLAATALVAPALGAGPALPGGRAIVATASVTPSTHLFGDEVRARLDLVVDPSQFDPDLLEVRLRFAPYEAVRGVRESRRRAGGLVHVRYETTLRCLHVGCLGPRAETVLGGQEEGRAERHTIRLPPATILYGAKGEEKLLLQELFPPLQVVSRINTAARGGYAASIEPPAPTYRGRPEVIAGVALALAGLLLLVPLALVARAVRDRVRARRRWRPLSPVERALVLVDWTAAREDGAEERRKALEALAVVLDEHGARPLAESTRSLAWAEEPPPRAVAGEAGAQARNALNGGSRARPA